MAITDSSWEECWKKCEEILANSPRIDGCFFSSEVLQRALLESRLAENLDILNRMLRIVRVQLTNKYTIYDVERVALALFRRPRAEDLFQVIVNTLDPGSTGIIYIEQLNYVLGRFGLCLEDLEQEFSEKGKDGLPSCNGTITHEKIRSIINSMNLF